MLQLPLPIPLPIVMGPSDRPVDASAVDSSRVARTLERYTRVASVNPTLGGTGEAALAQLVGEDLMALGARVEFQEVTSGRANVLGYVDVDPRLPTVTLDAHLDTVPFASAATNSPRWKGARLFARGACDDKASLAAMLEAVRHLVERAEPPPANIVVLGSIDEEVSCRGAEAAHALVGGSDLIIVGEPTDLKLGVWHKGTTRFEVDAVGVSSHSSMPHLGVNAIQIMAAVVRRLSDDALPALQATRHDSGEVSTMSVGSIAGGGPLNQVPASCTIGIDVRRVPGQASSEVLAIIDHAIQELLDQGRVVRGEPFTDSPAFQTSCSSLMLDEVGALLESVGVAAVTTGLPYGTNASRLAKSGAPTIVFGPGSIEVAHTDLESVDLHETTKAAECIVRLIDGIDAICRPDT